MSNALRITAASLAAICLIVYAWMFFPRSDRAPSPEELAQQALGANTDEGKERAAIALSRSASRDAIPHVRRVLRESELPQVRAACVRAIGSLHDYDNMDLLLDALEDESVAVRGRAGVAVVQMLGRDYHFRADASPQERAEVVKDIRQGWKELDGTPLLEHFKKELDQKESGS